ncbi:MAG: hypothetical protein H7Z19_07730, partial [Chitinophagaceae bacterium]|nr:hypothetical protein [Rubrivivax sp.]
MNHAPARTRSQRQRAALAIALSCLALTAPAGAAVMISQVYGGGGNLGATFTNDYVE